MASKANLLLLFDRPLEPSFLGKGDDDVVFNVPYGHLSDRYKPLGTQLFETSEDEPINSVAVKDITPPNLDEILELSRNKPFSLFLDKHQRLAKALTEIFLNAKDVDDLLSIAIYARDRVNPLLFNYAYSVALLHRQDTQHLGVPSLFFSFPEKFIDSEVFGRAREEAFIVPEKSREPIVIPIDFTASDLDPEHRLWYFREDIAVNLHHWHWHLVYPYSGPLEVVNKDRRGELFFYMHQQLIARYNAERLCNALARVERFVDWREPIKEAYFAKLNTTVAGRRWANRPTHRRLHNLSRDDEQLYQDVDDMVQWRDRIFAAIYTGFILNERGDKVPLTEEKGIDVLVNMVESSILSPNPSYYGTMHNMGHIFISFVHDPDGRYLEPFAVMGDSSVSMRDPSFYLWHGYLDYLFQSYKETLPPYTLSNLGYEGINVETVTVQTPNAPENELQTFWHQSDLDMQRGLDFVPRGPLYVRITHLQHHEFTYKIVVNNSGLRKKGTCRIFLSPKFSDKNRAWLFKDQRKMFIALDRFTVTLQRGRNVITRKSTSSTVTVPWEQSFRNLESSTPQGGEALENYNFCGCGWPHHMLLPKGRPEGFPCQLFVMISNYADDRIIQDVTGPCDDGDNYCGVKGGLYPDRRAMGFPFDRPARTGVTALNDFLTTNMIVQDVSVRFLGHASQPITKTRA